MGVAEEIRRELAFLGDAVEVSEGRGCVVVRVVKRVPAEDFSRFLKAVRGRGMRYAPIGGRWVWVLWLH